MAGNLCSKPFARKAVCTRNRHQVLIAACAPIFPRRTYCWTDWGSSLQAPVDRDTRTCCGQTPGKIIQAHFQTAMPARKAASLVSSAVSSFCCSERIGPEINAFGFRHIHTSHWPCLDQDAVVHEPFCSRRWPQIDSVFDNATTTIGTCWPCSAAKQAGPFTILPMHSKAFISQIKLVKLSPWSFSLGLLSSSLMLKNGSGLSRPLWDSGSGSYAESIVELASRLLRW